MVADRDRHINVEGWGSDAFPLPLAAAVIDRDVANSEEVIDVVTHVLTPVQVVLGAPLEIEVDGLSMFDSHASFSIATAPPTWRPAARSVSNA